jgi:hypothetical protein
MRLRTLTATYGSGVRTLYSKIEKAGQLDDWQYVVVFKTGKKDEWDDRTLEITPKQLAPIDETIEQLGLTKDVRRAKAVGTLALALPSFSAAVGVKMGQDELNCVIIDLKTLQEAVATS